MDPVSRLTVDPAAFRHVVGHLASGVTVITTRAEGRDYGMTASSVTSLSTDPPTMLACINKRVPTAEAVSRSGVFAVNILAQDQGALAQQFSTPSPEKFRNVNLTTGDLGLPLLSEALAHLECQVTEELSGGTHSIFLGQVVRASAQAGSPLTYFRGGFGRFSFANDDAVYLEARRRVLDRVYAPNGVISLDDLTFELGADSTATFYALTRLASDGLVRRDAERGYVVVPFDVRTSDEAFDARSAIELGVIDLIDGEVDAADLATLRARFETMSRLISNDAFVDFDAYVNANVALHEHVVALARNPALSAAYAKLSLKSVMTRSFAGSPETSSRFIDAQGALVEALGKQDTEGARAAVRHYAEIAKLRAREVFAATCGRL